MSEIKIKARIQNKYYPLEKWNKLTKGEFVPLSGEVCYAVDNNMLYQKIGDGKTDFTDLVWLVSQADWNQTDETQAGYIKNKPLKEITSPCHIATLEKGVYIVKNNLVGGYSGQVTFANVKDDKTIDDNYFALNGGLLIVHENIKEIEADGTETSIIGFTAQGIIIVPNKSYSGDVQGSPIEIETINGATSVQGYILESTKFAESTAPYEANKWYSTMPDLVFSDIPASAIKNEITTESTIYDIPSALAVKNYVGESINALQGNLDEVSALVGGA